MRINLHVDRLVLDGGEFRGIDDVAVTEAMSAELSRLLSTREIPAALRGSGALPKLGGSAIRMRGTARALGEDIGRAVHSGLADY